MHAQVRGLLPAERHGVNPNAKLHINDYNIESTGAKATTMQNLVKSLQVDGVPIDGIGMESYFIVGEVTTTHVENFQVFAALGVKIAITELDIRMTLPETAALLEQQARHQRWPARRLPDRATGACDVRCDRAGAIVFTLIDFGDVPSPLNKVVFYIQLFAVDYGVNSHITTYSLAILRAGSTLGRFFPTFLADKLGVYNMLVPAMVACAGLIFAMFGATNGLGVVPIRSIFGFALGRARLCRNMGELGVKMGLAYTFVAAANLIRNPIAGALLGTSTGRPSTWWHALVFTGTHWREWNRD
ncbi:glycoside hydrolase superfamily [Fomitopsis serialis]|uniref:glycoside hydrolase superfamily n=1 Tax=Fomitopsis serialis TaxID=139415 RepID=UPI002007C9B6|nr:glycoside hydrolase superfamily [Neoantrodia serialis]KAH9924184.1 glycoside hydrolase superfamily [Neoantrodia serialis]